MSDFMIIKPKNWSSMQHYHDRSPSWIKLHRSLLDNFDFHCLHVASRALAPCLWLLASEHKEGHIEVNVKKLAWRFRQDDVELSMSVNELISKGFFEVVQDASEVLAEPMHDASLEKRERREREEKIYLSSDDDSQQKFRRKCDPIPYQQIVDAYHRICCIEPFNRPTVAKITDKRKRAIAKIWQGSQAAKSIDWWSEYFTRCTSSKNWMFGSTYQNGDKWPGANFDFLLREDNILRVVEGAV